MGVGAREERFAYTLCVVYDLSRVAIDTAVEDRENGCWLWLRALDRDGYGKVTVDYLTKRAHRVVYELLVGPIPEGLVTDHVCRVRRCVNPAHIELVTRGENTRRGSAPSVSRERLLAETHCRNGHEFTPENMWVRRGKWRVCKTCASARRKRWLQK